MALKTSFCNQLLFGFFFSVVSFNSHAVLTSFTNDDPLTTSSTDTFVYSSVSDVTWSGNGNLLGTLINENNALITNIVSANSNITYGATNLTVEADDFSNDKANWEGAMGFVTYLNSVNYGGSSQWRLPTVVAGTLSNLQTNGQLPGDEFAELYTELGGTVRDSIDNLDTNNHFVNEVANNHWTGTEVAGDIAWNFNTFNGSQQNTFDKDSRLFTFVLTPGNLSQVNQVPEPKAYLMLLAGLTLLTFRRNRMQ